MDEPKLSISKYKRHQKKMPWPLIFKILIAILVVLLLFWLNKPKKESPNNYNEKIELIFD
jgi:short subunit fatty acids transporter